MRAPTTSDAVRRSSPCRCDATWHLSRARTRWASRMRPPTAGARPRLRGGRYRSLARGVLRPPRSFRILGRAALAAPVSDARARALSPSRRTWTSTRRWRRRGSASAWRPPRPAPCPAGSLGRPRRRPRGRPVTAAAPPRPWCSAPRGWTSRPRRPRGPRRRCWRLGRRGPCRAPRCRPRDRRLHRPPRPPASCCAPSSSSCCRRAATNRTCRRSRSPPS
mmetsp:Transcript_53466/g.148261  ORF Transcript_53466/g.148261 Transcript_53466/m.148261 type:complete len:220 (+) Transcript_53466:81-740(+)